MMAIVLIVLVFLNAGVTGWLLAKYRVMLEQMDRVAEDAQHSAWLVDSMRDNWAKGAEPVREVTPDA